MEVVKVVVVAVAVVAVVLVTLLSLPPLMLAPPPQPSLATMASRTAAVKATAPWKSCRTAPGPTKTSSRPPRAR